MGLKKSLTRKYQRFLLRRLLDTVRARRLRPFQVDEQGVWFRTEHGFSVFGNLVDRILELEVNPVWEASETAFVSANVRPGDTFFDVGANIGYFSMLAAQQSPARVVAFEPVPRTYDLLTRNLAHNGMEDLVHTNRIALGSEERTARSVDALGPKNHIEYAIDDDHSDLAKVDVRVATLDRFLADDPELAPPDFIKVDIEGYELEFLRGGRATLESSRPLLLMEVEERRLVKFGARAADVFGFLSELGYVRLCVRADGIFPAGDEEADLRLGRDFVFHTSERVPVY